MNSMSDYEIGKDLQKIVQRLDWLESEVVNLSKYLEEQHTEQTKKYNEPKR